MRENLLRGVSGLLSWREDGTPGVLTVLGGGSATPVLVAYVIVFGGIAAALARRRELA